MWQLFSALSATRIPCVQSPVTRSRMDLLLAAPGQTVFWQPQKRIAICSPPKVGTSFSHSWLVWSEVRPETACKYGVQQLSSEAKQFCSYEVECVDE